MTTSTTVRSTTHFDCGTCPSGYTDINTEANSKKCVIYRGVHKLSKSKQVCENYGEKLPLPHLGIETERVLALGKSSASIINHADSMFPIGLTYNDKIKDFVTSDGREPIWKHWAKNHFERIKPENYPVYFDVTKKWDLLEGNLTVTVICQWICPSGNVEKIVE